MNYAIEFIKSNIQAKNTGVLIYLILNVFIIVSYFTLYIPSIFGVIVGILIYGASIWLAMSPLGEKVLQWQLGAKEIVREEQLNRLMPLFEEVYEKAKKEHPNLQEDIKLYIKNDNEQNAFATGRRTICVNRGLLELSDDKIKAVLAHEFGHLSNKDTDFILFITIGNLFVTIGFTIARWIFLTIGIIIGIFNRSIGQIAITLLVDFILLGLMKLWTKLGSYLVLKTSRDNEYKADEFAHKIGYGNALIDVIDSFNGKNYETKGLFATLAASHPDPDQRIGHLQQLRRNENQLSELS